MEINGKTIVITGGGSGIGAAMARRFSSESPNALIISDIDLVSAKSVAAQVGGTPAHCDVADPNAIEALVSEVEDKVGPIDLFCSNAGILGPCDLSTDLNHWHRVMDVNLMSHIHAARALVPRMIARGGGYLLNTASAAGLLNQVGSASYAVSKHAAIGFGEWIAMTHAHEGIKISMLCPQAVDTPMVTVGGAMARAASIDGAILPEEVADYVVEGLRDERFLILPHPQVIGYMAKKLEDYDRWLRGMNKLHQKVTFEEPIN